jgi:DNA modification methylase
MGGDKAILCHADPPYGMGKENEGIENDNLYREKLDVFQMEWWKACRPSLEDNASAYIWGTSEDLFRLWFNLLSKSERFTFRNEIVWNKKSGQGMGSDAHRMYPTASERCLFFVIGEQGWNNNADNYWEGFEPIRAYLDNERNKMNWSNKEIAGWFDFHPRMVEHWMGESQWTFIREEQYKLLQEKANDQAFRKEYDELRKEYDELRKEWYATRAPFDNTHSLMTDVWNFDTMRGEERPDHPTPKPVEMISRIIQSSGTDDQPTLDPFCGSGTTMVACQNLNRKCRAIEISPAYCSIILERMSTAFPGIEIQKVNSIV